MQNAKVLSQKEVKAIIAEHFGVPENRVITSRYNYMVISDEESEDNKIIKEKDDGTAYL